MLLENIGAARAFFSYLTVDNYHDAISLRVF